MISWERLEPLLACPRCHAGLESRRGVLVCARGTCALSSEPFPALNDIPVLVDFERSILTRHDVMSRFGASPIARPRGSRARAAAKRVLSGENPVARRNEARFLDMLPRGRAGAVVLIVGSAAIGSGVRRLHEDPGVAVIGVDIYRSDTVTFVGDAHGLALGDETVDGVWIQAVLEHVVSPWEVVQEIARVLKPGGLVYAETPFLQPVHEQAYDFTRFTHSGHRWLFRAFEEIDSGRVGGAGTQLLWAIEHFSRAMFRSATAGKLARVLFAPLRFADAVCDAPLTLDAAAAFYFLGRKVEGAISAPRMVDYYVSARGRAVRE
jgi:SAM-dependent methyltransferase